MNICVSAIGASLDAEVGEHFAWNSDFSDRRYWNLGTMEFDVLENSPEMATAEEGALSDSWMPTRWGGRAI